MMDHPADVVIDALVRAQRYVDAADPNRRGPLNRDLFTARPHQHPCGPHAPWFLPRANHHTTLALNACAQQATQGIEALSQRPVTIDRLAGLVLEARIWHNGCLSVWAYDGHEYAITEHGLTPGQAQALLRSLRP